MRRKVVADYGDTEWPDALVEVARDADLFIGAANFFEKAVKYNLAYTLLRVQPSTLRP